MKRILRAVLVVVQILATVHLSVYEAVANNMVAQAGVQVSPVPQNTGVGAIGSLPLGSNSLNLSGSAMTPLADVNAIGVLPNLQTMSVVPSQTPLRTAAVSQAQGAPVQVQPLTAAPHLPPGAAAPLHKAVEVQQGPKTLVETSKQVSEALELPGLKEEAGSEASKGASETVFAALSGERLIQASGEADVTPARGTPDIVAAASRLIKLQQNGPVRQNPNDVPRVKGAETAGRAPSRISGFVTTPVARVAAGVAMGAALAAALPWLAANVGVVAAAGSITLSVIGIPQLIHNFRAGREGVKDLAIGSPLIWFAAATLLSVVSIGQGSSLWWNFANLAGVAESMMVLGQINFYKRDAKALKATLLTAAAVLAPLPLIAAQLIFPLSTWVSAAFTAAMGLLWVLNWPQVRQNYRLFKDEGRPPKGIAPLYPALVVLGSLMHLYAALMGGDLRWAMNAIIAIVTAGTVLAQIYAPGIANTLVGPLVRLSEIIRSRPQPRSVDLAGRSRKLVAAAFKKAGGLSVKAGDQKAALEEVLARAQELQGRSLVYLEAPTATGKSTLAENIKRLLGSRIQVFPVVRQPESLYMDRIASDIRSLLEGKRIELPVHDMETETTRFESGEYMELGPSQVLIVDSIYDSHERLIEAGAGHQSLNVYLTAPATARLARRIARDMVQRGLSAERNLSHWGDVLHNERRHILPLREKADVVVDMFSDAEMDRLQDALAGLLAQEWAARGHKPAFTRLFLQRIRESIKADQEEQAARR